LPDAIRSILSRLGVPAEIAAAEVDAMFPISVGLTHNRSVVGSMVDLGREASFKPDVFPFRAVGALLGVEIATPEWRVLH
jgi:hypothetical protein